MNGAQLVEQPNASSQQHGVGHRWKPGESGNPAGRPRRGETFKDTLQRIGEVRSDDARTKRELICERVYNLALEGVPWAVQWIVERQEGKAAVHIEVSKKDDLLRGMTDSEVADMIERANQKRIGNDNDVNI